MVHGGCGGGSGFVLVLVPVLGTLPLTLPLTALDATLHCSGTRPRPPASQPARAQHSNPAQHQHRRSSSHGGEKEKSQELAIPDLTFAFHHSSLPSIRAHSRPKPLCKAWPADAFFCLPPSIEQSRLLFCHHTEIPEPQTPSLTGDHLSPKTAGIGTPIFPVPLRPGNPPSRDT